MIHYHDKI